MWAESVSVGIDRWEAQREKLGRRDVKNEMNKLPIGTPASNQHNRNTSHTHSPWHTVGNVKRWEEQLQVAKQKNFISELLGND